MRDALETNPINESKAYTVLNSGMTLVCIDMSSYTVIFYVC